MRYALTYGGCGCLMAWDLGIASIITEVSGKAPLASDYDPIITEDERLIFPENTTEMSDTGTKISEFTTAPALTGMSYFTGVIDNGDDTFSNYNFTPDQLITYVMGQVREPIILTFDDLVNDKGDGTYGGFANNWLSGKPPIAAIATDDFFYQADLRFIQTDDTVIGSGISFYVGQKIILYL